MDGLTGQKSLQRLYNIYIYIKIVKTPLLILRTKIIINFKTLISPNSFYSVFCSLASYLQPCTQLADVAEICSKWKLNWVGKLSTHAIPAIISWGDEMHASIKLLISWKWSCKASEKRVSPHPSHPPPPKKKNPFFFKFSHQNIIVPVHDKTYKVACAPSEDSDQPGHPVWSVRCLHSLATQWAHSKDWSDWADAQADLSLHWAHMQFCWFCHVMAQL